MFLKIFGRFPHTALLCLNRFIKGVFAFQIPLTCFRVFYSVNFRRLGMGKRSDLSPRKKGQIRVLLEETSLTQKDIAKKLMVSPQVVNVISKSLKSGLPLSPRRRGKCGRRRLSSARDDRRLVNFCLSNRRATSRQLAIDWSHSGTTTSCRTVRRRLFDAGLRACRPLKKPLLTPSMMKKRLQWAKAHSTWTVDDWSKVKCIIFLIL